MLAEVIHIVQDVIQRIVIIGRMMLVSLTVVVLGILTGVVMLTDTVVVTEVDAISKALQRQLHLTIQIGKERVVAVVVGNQ